MSEQKILSKKDTKETLSISIDNISDPIVFFGDPQKVTSVYHHDHNEMTTFAEPRQRMEGFDNKYRDFVDYILQITHKIWEEKGIGVIYETYHNDCVQHFASLNQKGLNPVISGTLQALHAFPDRRLIGENVIWSEDPDHTYYSSHRIHSTATNMGDSNFGPATGKNIQFRTVADCKCYKNRIVEEWLVRDNLHIVKQLGLNPVEIAQNMAKHELSIQSFGLPENREGQFVPEIYQRKNKDWNIGDFIQEMISKVWGARYFNCLNDYYVDNAILHTICNQELTGIHSVRGWLISLFASFPNARVQCERVTCNRAGGEKDFDVSARWRILGMNEGIGFFGQPSNSIVDILGISQYKVRNGMILEEWLTFDALDVLKQMETYRLQQKSLSEE
ncbi:hypothetical protein CI610_01199 [invertebrate metagenome]|uniref:Polyketide cyclase n=1 Tax=invertebrate metagenome TaxID=1711999 RepID=A0A2H9T9C7_9ZZZZ